jgi:hypothetical protein
MVDGFRALGKKPPEHLRQKTLVYQVHIEKSRDLDLGNDLRK